MGLAINVTDVLDMLSELVGRKSKAIFSRRFFEGGFDLSQGLAATSPGIMCGKGVDKIPSSRKWGVSDVLAALHVVRVLNVRRPVRRSRGIVFALDPLSWVILRAHPPEFRHTVYKGSQLFWVDVVAAGVHIYRESV